MSYDRTTEDAWDDGYITAKLKAVKMLRDWAKEHPDRSTHDTLANMANRMDEQL